MDTIIAFLIAAVVLTFFVRRYLTKMKEAEARAEAAAEKANLRSDGPRAQHPLIEVDSCIGCAACVSVCPEGDVLGMIGGKAAILHGYKCIGHSLCAEACPVGAITMVMASPAMTADMPQLTPHRETTVKNLFIAGELGGLALIKNAIAQGCECVDTISSRITELRRGRSSGDTLDLVIVGAGPAGISASLRAIERKLNYITIEEAEIGGTVAKYPRQKLVMTSPVEFPVYGKFKKTELAKEELLAFWKKVLERADFKCRTGEKVEGVKTGDDSIFTVTTTREQFRAHSVILALGRAGSPRKLGVKGEDLPKVMYRLIEADHFQNRKILVVGGGDSAVEAAMGLAHQVGNQVTLSYRQDAFTRIKERNSQRMAECIRSGKVNVLFQSVPVEFKPTSVILDVNGRQQEIANDYVWIFAGGEPPTAFLKKIGVGFGTRDVTQEASYELKHTMRGKAEPAVLSGSALKV